LWYKTAGLSFYPDKSSHERGTADSIEAMSTLNFSNTKVLSAFLLTGLVVLLGCSQAHYRRAADNETYRIVQSAEQKIFGHTNQFDINTRYSHRKPTDIPASEIIDDRQQTNSRLLTLQEALSLAVTNSRTYQTEKENLYLTALSLTGDRHEFTPHFFSSTIGSSLERSPDGTQESGVGTSFEFGKLLRSGGRVSMGLANTLLHYYTGSPTRTAFSTAFAELTHPILRGFGWKNPQVENLTQAERDVIYAIRDFGFFQDQFAADIVADYFSLLTQKDVIRNRYTNYLGRVRSTQRLMERADRERPSDIGQTRQAELTAKNNYVNAVAQYQTALDQFKIRLGIPLGERIQLDDSLLRELASTDLVPVDIDPEEAFRLAVNKQLTILNSIDQYEDAKRKVLVAADQLRPGLNLVANATVDTQGDDYLKFDPDTARANVGATLDLPFDRHSERNEYRRRLVAFEQRLRDLSLTLDQLKDSIERGLRTLNQRKETFEIQTNALAVANTRVEAAVANLEAGRAEIRELVEAQDAQINAQNAVTQAIVQYQEARLELMLQIGLLDTGEEKFWLRDHVSNQLQAATAAPRQRAVENNELVPPDKLFEN
jgi:outer membrane protein TolC